MSLYDFPPRYFGRRIVRPIGPADFPPGERQQRLDLLAQKASLLRRASGHWLFSYEAEPYYTHPVFDSILQLFSERLRMRVAVEWESWEHRARVDALFARSPTEYGEDDFEVVVRCMNKIDRCVGTCGISISKARRTAYLGLLVRSWDSPRPTSLFSTMPNPLRPRP